MTKSKSEPQLLPQLPRPSDQIWPACPVPQNTTATLFAGYALPEFRLHKGTLWTIVHPASYELKVTNQPNSYWLEHPQRGPPESLRQGLWLQPYAPLRQLVGEPGLTQSSVRNRGSEIHDAGCPHSTCQVYDWKSKMETELCPYPHPKYKGQGKQEGVRPP